MSYQYGSDSPQISNPFKVEGLIFLLGGAFTFIIGLFSVLTLRKQILSNGMVTGWINLFISLLLLGIGTRFICSGLFKVFRFYVGRGAPASLSKNYSRSESHIREPELVYTPKDLEQMLMGRKNPTFVEPESLIERFVYSIFPNMIFLPYAIRNYVSILVKNTTYTFMALIIYLLALISGSVGLTKLTETSFSKWMGIILIATFLGVWGFNNISIRKIKKLKVESFNLCGKKSPTSKLHCSQSEGEGGG